jgi:hypothetical protein
MGARWYDSSLGRWTQPDSIIPESIQGGQAWDRFAYVNNNPILYIDPSGHFIDDGCEEEGCTSSWRDNVDDNYVRQREYNELCQGGHGQYCPDYREIAAFTITGLVLTSLFGEVIVGIPPEVEAIIASIIEQICADGNCENEIRTGSNVVYEGFNKYGQRYIGITNNITRRFGEHLRKGVRIQGIPGLENLSRSDARAVEQVLIEHYGKNNLLNSINSISVANPKYPEAIIRGQEILIYIDFFLE